MSGFHYISLGHSIGDLYKLGSASIYFHSLIRIQITVLRRFLASKPILIRKYLFNLTFLKSNKSF